MVIAGFTKNEGTGKYFSALAIGVYDSKGVLRYMGKVGTGFNDVKQKEMMAQSIPVTWDEVKPGLTMRDFTIRNAVARLKETGDIFSGVLGEGIDLWQVVQRLKVFLTNVLPAN